MDNPQETNLRIEENDLNIFKWFGGFFDAEGSISVMQSGHPLIMINQTNPLPISKIHSLLRKYGIESRINERSQPSKSSKKKRWDLSISKQDDAREFAEIMKNFIHGKKMQINAILNNKKQHDLMYLNQTNGILIKDDNVLWKKLGFEYEKSHTNSSPENNKIVKNEFNDIYYLAGIFDGEGMVCINQRENKHRDTDRFTPTLSLVNTNKYIIEYTFSTIQNVGIGCHISTRDSQNRNRIRWDLLVSGVARVEKMSNLLINKCIVKKQQLEYINEYCNERLRSPKSLNESGYNYKMAIQSIR